MPRGYSNSLQMIESEGFIGTTATILCVTLQLPFLTVARAFFVRYSRRALPSMGPSCVASSFCSDDDDLSDTTLLVTIVLNPVSTFRTKNARLTVYSIVCFSFTHRIRSIVHEN